MVRFGKIKKLNILNFLEKHNKYYTCDEIRKLQQQHYNTTKLFLQELIKEDKVICKEDGKKTLYCAKRHY